MAFDNTAPRLRLIGTIAVIVVVTLVGLDFVFKSYYAYMSDAAQREKLAPTRDKAAEIASDQTSLSAAKIPVEQAMAQIAKGARDESIAPRASDDMGPMTGWSKLPKQLPGAAGAGATGAAQILPSGLHTADGQATDGGLHADASSPPVDAGAKLGPDGHTPGKAGAPDAGQKHGSVPPGVPGTAAPASNAGDGGAVAPHP